MQEVMIGILLTVGSATLKNFFAQKVVFLKKKSDQQVWFVPVNQKTAGAIVRELAEKKKLSVQVQSNETGANHYNPKANVIQLAADVHNEYSVTDIATAVHEFCHAQQDPFLDAVFVPVMKGFGKLMKLVLPVLIVSLAAGLFFDGWVDAVRTGSLVGYFGIATCISILQLFIEGDASIRASRLFRQEQLLGKKERKEANVFLFCAYMTYGMAFTQNLGYVLLIT